MASSFSLKPASWVWIVFPAGQSKVSWGWENWDDLRVTLRYDDFHQFLYGILAFLLLLHESSGNDKTLQSLIDYYWAVWHVPRVDSVSFLHHLASLPPHPGWLQGWPGLGSRDISLHHELHLRVVLAPGQPHPQHLGAGPQRSLDLPPFLDQTEIVQLVALLAFQFWRNVLEQHIENLKQN